MQRGGGQLHSWKRTMPQTCSAAGCKSRKDKDCKKSFYRIPVDRSQRERWLAAINRKDWTPTPYSRICSDHFVLGQPSKDPKHPDYAPSIFLEPKKNRRSKVPSHINKCRSSPVLAPINTPTDQNKRQLSDVDAAETLLHMSKRPRMVKEDCNDKEDCDKSQEGREGLIVQQTNYRVALLQTENRLLKEEISRLKIQRSELEQQRKSLEIEKTSLGNQNKQLEAGILVLWRSLQDSEGRVKVLKNEMFLMSIGAEIVSSHARL